MSYEIKGTVKSVSAVEQVTEKFSKRELVVEHGDKYPQLSKFESSGDRNALLDSVNEGDTVTVHFDLRGRAGRDGRVWNTLSIWKVNVNSKAALRPSTGVIGDGQDDIPF